MTSVPNYCMLLRLCTAAAALPSRSLLTTGCSSPADGTIDLWVEEEYNAASRMPAGVPYGRKENVAWSGKEKADPSVAVHTVKITCAPARKQHACFQANLFRRQQATKSRALFRMHVSSALSDSLSCTVIGACHAPPAVCRCSLACSPAAATKDA